MSSKLNLRQTLVDFLKARPEERFTARQIADWIFANLRDGREATSGVETTRSQVIFRENLP